MIGDFLSRIGGGRAEPLTEPTAEGPPTVDALAAALARTEALVSSDTVPSPVTARVLRVTATVRDTLPRLDQLGAGSATAYTVMATATDYLPDAVNGYLRLPRRFADTRPVDAGRTSLMVLIDQLDLLGATMDRVFDAVYRSDANALVAHGRFLAEKFDSGRASGPLSIAEGQTPVPVEPPDGTPHSDQGRGHEQGRGQEQGQESMPATEGVPPDLPAESSAPAATAAAATDPATATAAAATDPDAAPAPSPAPGQVASPPATVAGAEQADAPANQEPQRLRPPSSLDL